MIVGLVLAPLLLSVTSLAVIVTAPAVFKVTVKVRVPLARAAFAGRVALPSLEVILTVSVAVLITFQLASTALTIRLNAEPAVRTLGVPTFPEAVPGAAVSPGTSN